MSIILKWENATRKTINSGTVEQSYILTDTSKAIIGLGFAIDDSNVKAMKVDLIDLNTKAKSSATVGDKKQGIEWECVINADDYVLTGLGLNAGNTTMYPGYLYGQKIEEGASNSGYLSGMIGRFQNKSVDKEESRYIPAVDNTQIIVGVEVGVKDGDIAALYITQATLAEVE